MQSHWQLVTDLFDRCLELTADERGKFLAAADATVAAEVRSLLEAFEQDQDFLEQPATGFLAPQSDRPQRVGEYQILMELGQGGMGSVMLARRSGPFEQLVAIKLIRSEYESGHLIAQRFVQERQILASLQHPYIAHLLDGGTTEENRPYLVIEYVRGLPIDRYCNGHQLSIAERIDLFLKVCEAVQHAHQMLVVHRDLKPANILVQEDGTPKLLDFGIAKLLSVSPSEPSLTRTTPPFTPRYASPEQLRGEQAGTASDVYSLGLLLYELLTGAKPHAINTESALALAEVVCREVPPNASSAINRHSEKDVETEAALRSTSKSAWSKILRGDLDVILAHALCPEPKQRYQTVQQFAADLTSYRKGLPVSVHKYVWTYRAAKFLRRHKGLVSIAVVSLGLLALSGFTVWREAQIARREEQKAERRFNDLRQLAHSNLTEIQDELDKVPGGTAVRALVLARATEYLNRLASERGNDVDLQRELANGYRLIARRLGNPGSANLGDTAAAETAYRRSLKLFSVIVSSPEATATDRRSFLVTQYHLAILQSFQGKLKQSTETLRAASDVAEGMLARHTPELPK